jgi:hypothetical protein
VFERENPISGESICAEILVHAKHETDRPGRDYRVDFS